MYYTFRVTNQLPEDLPVLFPSSGMNMPWSSCLNRQGCLTLLQALALPKMHWIDRLLQRIQNQPGCEVYSGSLFRHLTPLIFGIALKKFPDGSWLSHVETCEIRDAIVQARRAT